MKIEKEIEREIKFKKQRDGEHGRMEQCNKEREREKEREIERERGGETWGEVRQDDTLK